MKLTSKLQLQVFNVDKTKEKMPHLYSIPDPNLKHII